MAEIQEIPVDNAAENQKNAAENQNNAAENQKNAAENQNNAAEIISPPPAEKKRGRPKGALNKKPKAPTQPAPVQPAQPTYFSPPAQPTYFSPPAPQYLPPPDPAVEFLSMFRHGLARQREHRVAKYAGWVQRF
jgi:hypothetical protein